MGKRACLTPIAALLAVVVLGGCGAPVPEEAASSRPAASNGGSLVFTDSLGREVSLPGAPKCVVSRMGSYAETWLLAGGTLAGVTSDVVSERCLQVDEAVTKIIGTVKSPDLEAVLGLSPDFILLSTDIESHVTLGATLEKAAIPHAYFKVEYFEDYLRMLKICTGLTGRTDLYAQNGLRVREKIDTVLSKLPTAANKRPTALFIRALSTTAKAKTDDNMTGRMLSELGVDNIAARHDSLLEDLSMETILEEDPDYIFVTTMGDSAKAIEALKNGIQANPAWNSLSAVKNDRYIVLDKTLFHYKPNAKWGESYETLAKILYPEVFHGQTASAGA